MRTLAFDGRMGASGDTILGALIAAGADSDVLAPVEDSLDVEYEVGETVKNGIAATTVDVLLTGSGENRGGRSEEGAHEHESPINCHDRDCFHEHDHSQEHDHEHNHSQEHDHGHENQHAHHHPHDTATDGESNRDESEHRHAEGAGPHRSYAEVVELVEAMDLDPDVESNAVAIFTLLGEAEANVHGESLEDIHFHEVGADDAIADVVGASLLLADLDVDRVVTTPVSAGGGTVSMSHGTYPVPGPATVEIAKRADWELRGGPLDAELLTPTGAAILAHLADGVDHLPSMRVADSGYGAGSYAFPDHANVLRAIVGETMGDLVREEITVLETTVDDVSPEVLGGLQSSLADEGARDVSIVPVTMKKSRPGHQVQVIVRPADAERVARRLAEETGTLGVRAAGATHRWIARREIRTVTVELEGESYEIDVKVASDASGEIYDVSAEYDDAAAVAEKVGLPVRTVLRRAETAVEAAESYDESDGDESNEDLGD